MCPTFPFVSATLAKCAPIVVVVACFLSLLIQSLSISRWCLPTRRTPTRRKIAALVRLSPRQSYRAQRSARVHSRAGNARGGRQSESRHVRSSSTTGLDRLGRRLVRRLLSALSLSCQRQTRRHRSLGCALFELCACDFLFYDSDWGSFFSYVIVWFGCSFVCLTQKCRKGA